MSRYPEALARTLIQTAGAWLVLASLSTLSFAQGVTGTVNGTVRDAQGGVIPGATVTLISEGRNTRSVPVVTNTQGDFVFPNVTADTYTLEVEMPSFRTLRRAGVAISPGSIVALGNITIEVGAQSEIVNVTAETPLVQTASGERSFTVTTESVANLPLNGRTFEQLLSLAPGVVVTPGELNPAARAGGGGGANYMLDGATAMDPGINRPATRVSVEALSEVKLVTSTYQAEYARSAGLQINAVTKSGTNQFRGSIYNAMRDSDWNANRKTNIINGDPKPLVDQMDYGFSVGGPVGRPGGQNKLFFYFNLEFNPRTFGGDVNRYRVPTLLERQGDFSQSRDNNGNLYPLIKDPQLAGTCSASDTRACFQDGGVLGRIPANRLYQSGLNVLKWWPGPNIDQPPGQAYNFESVDPKVELLGYQPVIRTDYQPTSKIRGSFKFLEYQQPSKPLPGTIPGFNDTQEHDFGIWMPAATFNWTISSTMFLEASFGANFHHQEGCSITGGEPNYCRTGLSVTSAGNRSLSGFGDIPYLFPDATVLDPNTFTYWVLNQVNTTMWDGTRIVAPPQFSFGTRVANPPHPNMGPFGNNPGVTGGTNFILDTRNRTWNASLTKVRGQHTLKGGYYYFRSLQRRGAGNVTGNINFGNDANNPLDTTFGFSNAAVGVFSTYAQTSRWAEGAYLAVNHEAFVQDNWRLSNRLTLDFGVRFAHMRPQYDSYGFSSNFLPEEWNGSQAPRLYTSGCVNNVYPCAAANRRAMDPLTGQMLGPNSALAVGTLVPNTGSVTNGIFASGEGPVSKTNYTTQAVGITPRVGAAWDVKGNQSFVVRGGAGLFYDRPPANTVYGTVNNPPFTRSITVRYGQLQNLSATGLATEAAPSLTVWQYDNRLSASTQWNAGIQMSLPFSAALDVAYTGQHSYDTNAGVNINSIDLGMAFLPAAQNPALATTPASTDPATSYASTNPDLVRFYKGYAAINQQQPIGWRTYHSLQIAVNRRFRNGLLFGFNDTIGLSDMQNAALRIQHNADGTITTRADQAKANELLGDNHPQAHLMRAQFVWNLPRLPTSSTGGRVLGYILNDWSLSGIWSGASGTAYSVTAAYQNGGGNVNLTGSPDFAPRVRVAGDIGTGCSADPLRQFTAAGFLGPVAGSDGLESGNGYLTGCFVSALDLAIARTIKLGGNRSIQLRADVFNVFNQAAITNRQTTMNLSSPSDPATITNLPYDAAGNIIPARSRPTGAGFGVATDYQPPRTVQLQARFSF
jgi:Carboxypeptidase regulatory-like domain